MPSLMMALLFVLPALAGPAPATDPALPDARLHLGLGAGVSGSSGSVWLGSSLGWSSVSYGLGSSLRLRLPGGLGVEPMLGLVSTSQRTWSDSDDGIRIVTRETEVGLALRPVLARRGPVELSAVVGVGYSGARGQAEEDVQGEDTLPTDQTTGSGGGGQVTVPAEETPDLVTRYHGGELNLGLGLTRWFDPTLSLTADLTLGGGLGGLQTDTYEVASGPGRDLQLALELDPAVRLSLHLWL